MPNEIERHKKAEQIRSVIRYIKKFKNSVVVIYIDDEIINTPLFSGHIRDISFIHQAGLNVVIVPGARNHIDKTLRAENILWQTKNGYRVTSEEAMPLIKTAAFETSNIIMTSLAGQHLPAVIGNWVRARGKGVIDGFDYGTAGEIDKLEIESIRAVLAQGFIPIFPCIGWSLSGKPYNISSLQLAEQIAEYLQAEKLFYIIPQAEISKNLFTIPEHFGLSDEGCIPAMSISELDEFISVNRNSAKNDPNPSAQNSEEKEKMLFLLELSKKACTNGVRRSHILNGLSDGVIPCEIFSDLGSGTMIYTNNYGKIREMTPEDIPGVLRLMRPFVKKGILLPRTDSQLAAELKDFIVYELDGGIKGCAALHTFDDKQGEIAGLAVDESCSHIGIGPQIISHLISRAKDYKLSSVFVLTTQTADWFENLGFHSDSINTLPEKRKNLWTPDRNSKLFRIVF